MECLDGSVLYYTSLKQFEELLAALDPVIFEAELFEKIGEVREDIEAHMTVTENLTNQKKPSHRKTYIELENGKSSTQASLVFLFCINNELTTSKNKPLWLLMWSCTTSV